MFIYFCVYIGICVGLCMPQPHVEARVQLLEVSSLLPPHDPRDRLGSLGLTTGAFTNQLDHVANREPACYRKIVFVCLFFETQAHTSPNQPRIHCLTQAD